MSIHAASFPPEQCLLALIALTTCQIGKLFILYQQALLQRDAFNQVLNQTKKLG